MEELKRLAATLDNPVKRIGFVVLALGALFTLIGLIQIASSLSSYRWFEKLLDVVTDALVFDRYTYRRYPMACIGPYVLLTGLLCSFLYDRTIGRFVAWIRHG